MNKVGGMLQRVDYVRKVCIPAIYRALCAYRWLLSSCGNAARDLFCLVPAHGIRLPPQYAFAVMCILKNEKGEFPIR